MGGISRLVRAVAAPAPRHPLPRHLRPGLCLLDPEPREAGFAQWVQTLHGLLTGQVVALDGKTARRSHNRSHDRSALHTVSAYICESRRGWALGDPEYLRYVDPEGRWPDLRSLLQEEAERRVGDQVGIETRYFISSHPPRPGTCWQQRGRTGGSGTACTGSWTWLNLAIALVTGIGFAFHGRARRLG